MYAFKTVKIIWNEMIINFKVSLSKKKYKKKKRKFFFFLILRKKNFFCLFLTSLKSSSQKVKEVN